MLHKEEIPAENLSQFPAERAEGRDQALHSSSCNKLLANIAVETQPIVAQNRDKRLSPSRTDGQKI